MKSIFKFSIILMVLFSCHRDKKEVIGPGYISAPKGFAVTSFTATPASIDFITDSVVFNATFTNEVTWILTITGETSGAIKEIRGTGKTISAVWKGTNTSITFFRTGENVSAVLSFFWNPYTAKCATTINIAKAHDFTVGPNIRYPKAGDFENTSLVLPVYPSTYSPYWASFNFPTPIPHMSQGIDSVAVDYTGNIVPSVQGSKYYFIKGLGNQPQFVSGLQYFAPITPALPPTPDNIWVNVYIYGTGDANAAVDLEYQEDDYGLGKYYPDIDDAWVTHLTLDHKGWKLFSFKYTDLVQSTNVGFGDKGNHIREPKKLVSFDIVLLKKTNPADSVEVYFDFPVITVGGPFDPNK